MAWQIDFAHSQIQFSVRHMMISNVRGVFEKFSGAIEFDEQDFTRSSIDVHIEAASVNTKEEKRDAHLRSADFFDAEKYPYLTFKSKNIAVTGSNTGRVLGDLTIRGVTREVVLEVEYVGSSKSPWGATNAGFNAHTKLNRKEWGLEWNVALETGGFLVGDDINISIELELVKVEQPATEATKA